MKLFSCKTSEAHSIKVLSELLYHNIKVVAFCLSKEGIHMTMTTDNKLVLFDLFLDAKKFIQFKYNYSEEKKYIGLNVKHFHDMMKNIKKRDVLELIIEDENPNNLNIHITPKENTFNTKCVIRIQPIIQIETCDVPEISATAIIINSANFQKMCRSLEKISKVVLINTKNGVISFSSSPDSIVSRLSSFGEEDPENRDTYNAVFDTEQIVKIAKIAGFNRHISVYTDEDNPILFQADIATIGRISVFIKLKDE